VNGLDGLPANPRLNLPCREIVYVFWIVGFVMGVHLHLIEQRLLGSVASWVAALMHLGEKFGRRRGYAPIVFICLSLAWPVPLTQEIDEGEFSRRVLGYKLQLLKSQFEQTEMRLLTKGAAALNAEKLERIYSELKRLETEFGCERYYPDLLDEQIVIILEELRLILVDPAETTSSRNFSASREA
jgi:hypothetical protein